MRFFLCIILLFWAGFSQADPLENAPHIPIKTRQIDILPEHLSGLVLLGTTAIRSPDNRFGGLSDMIIRNRRLIAVSDRGFWVDMQLRDTPLGLHPKSARLVQMRSSTGAALDKDSYDAEGLALGPNGLPDDLIVSFERDHRIVYAAHSPRLDHVFRDQSFRKLPYNEGLEAIASLPDGQLLAFSEQAAKDGFAVYLITGWKDVRLSRLPRVGNFALTGADIGPDNRLYLLYRNFTLLGGLSIRVLRYRLGEDGLPDPDSAENLVEMSTASGTDNMEGISVWRDTRGRTRMALLSDDNYNLFQRTLLMDFVVKPTPPA